MRPINKGSVPLDARNQPKVVKDYKEWRKDLMDRIGQYCCYCDMQLNQSLNVEHVYPKSDSSVNPLDWDNLLLACNACNAFKGTKPLNPAVYYQPEVHNTHLPFVVTIVFAKVNGKIEMHAIIQAKQEGRNPQQIDKATKTIELFKFTNIDKRNAVSDLRSKKRFEVCVLIQTTKDIYYTFGNKTNAIEHVIAVAKTAGFFTLWWDTFKTETLVLEKLLAAFPGTDSSCYDPKNGNIVNRNPNNNQDPT